MTGLPRQLCCVGLVWLGELQRDLWWWHTVSHAQCDRERGQRRQRLSNAEREPKLQRTGFYLGHQVLMEMKFSLPVSAMRMLIAGLSHQLCCWKLECLGDLQCYLRRWHAIAHQTRGRQCSQ